MWTMQGRMVGWSNSIRMVRKTSGRIRFMGSLRPFGLFLPCFQLRMPTKQVDWVWWLWGRVKGQAGLTCGKDDPPCPHIFQLQTLWTGGILTGKMIICRDKCFAKVVPTMVICSAGNLLGRFTFCKLQTG